MFVVAQPRCIAAGCSPAWKTKKKEKENDYFHFYVQEQKKSFLFCFGVI
jgi:hypothetical protein